MKGKLVSVVTMFIIGALLMSTLGFIRPALATYRIYLDPSTNTYTSNSPVGTTFDVTVKVDDVPDPGAAAFQVYLEFNDNFLNVTKWVEPTADAAYLFNGKTTSANPTPPDPGYVHISPGKAKVMVAANEFPTPPAQTPVFGAGPFKLCIFTFKITALPEKLGSLSCTLKIDTSDTYLLGGDGNELGAPVKENGSYSDTWVAPASPYMGISATPSSFGPFPPSAVGLTSTVTLSIKSLSAAWYLTTATFDLTFDEYIVDVVGGAADVAFDPIWGVTSVTFDYTTAHAAKMSISVGSPTTNPSGTVKVADVTFTVMHQNNALPQPPPNDDLVAVLTYSNVFLYDHVGDVPHGTSESATITVYALQTLKLPWLAVTPPSIVLGPDPSIGEEFDVGIKLTGPAPDYLQENWYLVGAQFRLFYDDTIIEPVSITEGPFLQDPTWNLYGTFFYGTVETDGLGPHVLVGTLLLPDGLGSWDRPTFPNGEGIIATIRFKALVQECPNSFECDLALGSVFGEYFIDKDGNYIPADTPHDGHYTMLPFDTPGRVIDVYGGAVNDGYGVLVGTPYLQFPTPYGGQGPNHWMDIVFPQSQIYLNALVTYNYWPVQSKDVGFEIEGPYEKDGQGNLIPRQRYQIWDKETSTTDTNGIATLTYRMPWPCEDPDGITGIWKITATAIVADVQIHDVIIFYYQRLVYITSVTTDKYYYVHAEYVKVTVDYETHAVQTYPALFSIVIKDDLLVPFGMALYATTVGGATFCTWKPGEFEVEIFIPKWAYAGYGHVHVNCYDKDPTDGGFAWIQEYTPLPEIQIGPY